MGILRALTWVGITLIVLIAGGVLYLSFADLSWLKPRIESAVADATGRKLQLGGAFDLDIVPSPAIVLEDVSLSNAEWGSEPMMARVGHVSAWLDLWSLVSGPVRVKELRLSDVDVLLETNEQGEANWAMGEASELEPAEQPDTGAEGGGVPVIVESAQLRDIRVRHKAPGGEPFVATLASLDLSTDEAQYTVLDGKGEVDELPLRLAGKLGPAQALASGTGIGIDLNTALANVELDVDGTIDVLAPVAGLDVKAVVSSDELAPILEHFAVDLPLSGPVHVETVVTSVEAGTRVAVDAKAGEIAAAVTATQQDGTVSFEAAVPALDKVGEVLEIQGLPAQDLAVDGRVVITPQAYQLQGVTARLGDAELKLDGNAGRSTDAAAKFSIGANGPSLATLSAGLPQLPFKAALTASVAPEQLVLDGIETTFGESDLAGSLEIAMADKTAITGKFKSQRLDLTPFAAGGEEAGKEKKKADKTAPEAKQGKSKSKYVFVEDPLSFEELNKADIDVDTDIGRFTLNNLVLLDVSTAVDLKGGKLRFKNRFRGPEGGRSASDVALATADGSARLDMKVNMRDLRVNLISGDVEDPSLIPPIGITVDLMSDGGSPRALASSANGRVLVTQGKGRMENDLLAMVSGDIAAQLFSALNPFAKHEKTTGLDCTILALDITNGKADIAGMLFQTEKVKVVGDGDIDLNTEALNIEFNTKPRSGIGVSADMFVTPFVKLVGTLASPRIGVDEKGTLLTGAAVAATGGLALVAKGAADRATGQIDRCKTLLEEVGGHPPLND
jgi:uncharacterized protein involved in outer membrane biogenesis